MTDTEFDELDKAVGSVMSDRPLPQLSAAPRTTVSQRPKSGRFMDIKSPSSSKPADAPKPKPNLELISDKLSTDMPDPLTMHEEKLATKTEAPKTTKPDEESAKSELEAGSPFLPDTKVEKRPLGAFSSKADKPMEMKLPLLSGSKSDEYEPPTDSKLPEELQRDVLKVEGDSTVKETPLENNTPVSVPAPALPDSEKPSPTPVFDTKDYHAALKHAQKKKSGWLTVVMIMLVILVGAGVGAAVYFFVINPR